MTPKACWLKSFYTVTFSSFSTFSDFRSSFVSSCVFWIEKFLHEATYQCIGITYMPKTENLFAKLPPQIAHILEYSTMLRYDLTSSMYSSYYYLPRDLNQGQVSKWYNPTVFAISITYTCCLPNPRPTAWCSSTLYSKLLSIST